MGQSDEGEPEPLISFQVAAVASAGLIAGGRGADPDRGLSALVAKRPEIGIRAASVSWERPDAVRIVSVDDLARPSLPLDEGGDRDRRVDAIE